MYARIESDNKDCGERVPILLSHQPDYQQEKAELTPSVDFDDPTFPSLPVLSPHYAVNVSC